MSLNTLAALAASPLPQFRIRAVGPVSLQFLDAGIHTFHEALLYVRYLPYGRTTDNTDLARVFGENRGTCSTKHTLLATLAQESGYPLRLMLGVYRMKASNTPGVGPVLEAHGLDFLPEAHCYLMWEGSRYDFTVGAADPVHFEGELLEERELALEGAPVVKKEFHREFLKSWLAEQPDATLSPDGLWQAREACIEALAAEMSRVKSPETART